MRRRLILAGLSIVGAAVGALAACRAAAGQLAVFGSEPGEADYSSLWTETILTWKAGSTPLLITSDNQINKLEKTSGLTERPGNVVLNCPIVKVG